MATAIGPKIVTNGLTFLVDAANRKSYIGSGTNIKDLASQINGTMTNATFSENENAFEFDGSGDYIDMTSASVLDNIWAGGGTLEMWCSLRSDGEGSFGRLFSKENHDNAIGTTGTYIDIREESGGAVKLLFAQQFGSIRAWITTNRSIILNKWYQVVVTYNHDSDGNTPIIYLNENVVPLSINQSGTGAVDDDSGNNFYIGNANRNAAFNRSSDGFIASTKIYNRIITAAEVHQNFQTLRSRFGL